MYEILEQHETMYEQSNEDDYKKINDILQQNIQQDDRQNYFSELILIDMFIPYSKKNSFNKFKFFKIKIGH
jgi:hypothetical protein